MKFWQNWTYAVYNKHTKFQTDIFIPAWLITKRIKEVLFSKFTKSAFRFLDPKSVSVKSVTHCSLTFGDMDTRILLDSIWCILHFSPTFVAPDPLRVDETDDPSLWNSVRLLLENLLQRYSREKDHRSHQLYKKPGYKCWREMEDTPGTNQEYTCIRIPKRKWTVSNWLHRHRLWIKGPERRFCEFWKQHFFYSFRD